MKPSAYSTSSCIHFTGAKAQMLQQSTFLPGTFISINYLNDRLQNIFCKFDFKFITAEQEIIFKKLTVM